MMTGRVRETGPAVDGLGRTFRRGIRDVAKRNNLRSSLLLQAALSNDLLKLGTDIVAVIWLGVQGARRLSFSPKLLQLLRDWWCVKRPHIPRLPWSSGRRHSLCAISKLATNEQVAGSSGTRTRRCVSPTSRKKSSATSATNPQRLPCRDLSKRARST
jgi:hypothetical protein